MDRPLRIEYPGVSYHVTARGNEQRKIYKSIADRKRFRDYLISATERYGTVIHGWCMMTNHYHLLMETPEGNLSQIMRHINGVYTNYFNTKQGTELFIKDRPVNLIRQNKQRILTIQNLVQARTKQISLILQRVFWLNKITTF